MTRNKKNKVKVTIKRAKQWKQRASEDRANRKQISRAQEFALELLNYLDENKISQVELAEKMHVKPQQVNKILRAKSNLTFDTIDKIEAALGVKISTPTISNKKPILSKPIKCTMKLVHKSTNKQIEPILEKAYEPAKNPILDTTLESLEFYDFTIGQI